MARRSRYLSNKDSGVESLSNTAVSGVGDEWVLVRVIDKWSLFGVIAAAGRVQLTRAPSAYSVWGKEPQSRPSNQRVAPLLYQTTGKVNAKLNAQALPLSSLIRQLNMVSRGVEMPQPATYDQIFLFGDSITQAASSQGYASELQNGTDPSICPIYLPGR
jgi:hypothetical protein